jgi:dienelactone hydrolase
VAAAQDTSSARSKLCLVDAFAFALQHDRRNIAPEIRSGADAMIKGLVCTHRWLNTVRDAYGRAGSLAHTALAHTALQRLEQPLLHQMSALMARRCCWCVAAALALAAPTFAAPQPPAVPEPIEKPLGTSHAVLFDDKQDESDHKLDVYYPTRPNGATSRRQYPLLAFAHGMYGGGIVQPVAYYELLHTLAGFGFVVVAPRACTIGCHCPLGTIMEQSLPGDPPCFARFYEAQLRSIEWSREQAADPSAGSAAFAELDVSAGAGVVGHSMGGQATLFSSSQKNASRYDIRAAVMHHAFTHTFPAPKIPFLAFTGTQDTTAPPFMAEKFFNAPGASAPRGLVNRISATHHEPDIEDYNPLLPQFTAAWFKLYLQRRPEEFGIDFESLIWGDRDGTNASLCGGGGGRMAECSLVRG